METKHNRETLKEGFVTGLNGILEIIEFKSKPLKPKTYKLAVIATCIFIIIVIIFKISLFEAIQEIVSLSLNLLPGILGFTIGGYGFLIGFIQPGLMNKISEPRPNTVFSLFQLASASFAFNIIIQAISLCLMYMLHFITWIDQKNKISSHLPSVVISGCNFIGLCIAAFSFTLSVAVIVQIVLNVFNFSQLHHYNINKEKVDNKEQEVMK